MEIVSSSCGPSVTLFLLHSEDLDGGYGSAEMQPERRARRRNAGRLWPPCPPLHSGLKALNLRGMGTCVREDLMDLLIERNQLG
jgi:hypothetical protein